MNKFERIYKALSNYNHDRAFFEAANDTTDQVVNIVIDRIYKRGTDIFGKKLKRLGATYTGYSRQYTVYKRRAGKYQGYIDLSFTGRYLKSFNATVIHQGILVGSKDHVRDGYNLSRGLRDFYGRFEGFSESDFKRYNRPVFLPAYLRAMHKQLK